MKLTLCLLCALVAVTTRAASTRTDIEYGQAAGERLLLDACIPDGSGPFPTVILVHGGGWSAGDKSGGPQKGYMAPMHDALTKAGFAWFSINYRLTPKHPHPAQIEDLETAIRWVKAHAAEYHVDLSRLALSGESAGGQMVALAAVRADASTRVTAVVPFYGLFDFRTPSEALGKPIPSFAKITTRKDEKLSEDVLKLMHDISAIDYVKPGLPPFLLVHGTADKGVPYEQSVNFQARLRAAGVPCDLFSIKDGVHGMISWDKVDPTYRERVVAWLKTTLKVR